MDPFNEYMASRLSDTSLAHQGRSRTLDAGFHRKTPRETLNDLRKRRPAVNTRMRPVQSLHSHHSNFIRKPTSIDQGSYHRSAKDRKA